MQRAHSQSPGYTNAWKLKIVYSTTPHSLHCRNAVAFECSQLSLKAADLAVLNHVAAMVPFASSRSFGALRIVTKFGPIMVRGDQSEDLTLTMKQSVYVRYSTPGQLSGLSSDVPSV